MRRTALIFAAIALMALAVYVPSTSANGYAEGKTFYISLQDLPDVCPTDATMTGTFAILIYDDGTKVRQTINWEVVAETPFGPAVIAQGQFKLLPGRKREVPIRFYVEPDAPLGPQSLMLAVTNPSETLSVRHDVEIVGAK